MKPTHLKAVVACALAALFAMALVAPVAAQASETPAKGYSQFAGCPDKKESSIVVICLLTEITGGHFQMGTKDVPIEKTMKLSGGADGNSQNFAYNANGGLTPVKQKVPGGVIGLTGLTFLLELLGSEALTLYAVTELAGTPDVSNIEEVKLPIKVHLVNSVLGSKCYVGSNSNPIKLNLIFGTTNPPEPNKPITGKFPEFDFNEELSILRLLNGEVVDNSFAAPGASGCVLTLFGFIPISINGLVNTQSGLPSAAGHNETRQNVNIEETERALVYP
jgi:hypothetical protein